MIGLEDRSVLAQDIEMAHRDGARLKPACAEAGITGHRLMVSVRMLAADDQGRYRPTHADVDFELALCA